MEERIANVTLSKRKRWQALEEYIDHLEKMVKSCGNTDTGKWAQRKLNAYLSMRENAIQEEMAAAERAAAWERENQLINQQMQIDQQQNKIRELEQKIQNQQLQTFKPTTTPFSSGGGVVNCAAPNSCFDFQGRFYNGPGTTKFRSDGCICNFVGGVVQCN